MEAAHTIENDDGFTLLELLIVIVILGVLATVVVFAVGGITDRGEVAALESDARTLEVAEESHLAQQGTYASEEDLVVAGFLHAESDIHDIEYTPGDSTYTLIAEGSGTTTTVAPATTVATTTTVPAVPTGYAGFSGQATGSGSKTLVIIGNGGASTQALYTMLTTSPLPDTVVIWLDGNDIDDTDDVNAVMSQHPTYMVAADSVPISRTFSPFGTTFVGQYMDSLLESPTDFWWTHQHGNPTVAELLSHL